jgi:hypothetical protein
VKERNKMQQVNNKRTNNKNDNKTKTNNKGNNNKTDATGEQKPRGPFPSNVMGAPIVNAITGVKYPWTVGSFEENHLWKVANCTRFTPALYFYDSPEQYEAYRRVELDAESKEVWHNLQRNLD